MRLAPFPAPGARTTGHWVLSALWAAALALVVAHLWWFGAEWALRWLGPWFVAAALLALASYGRTRAARMAILALALGAAAAIGFLRPDVLDRRLFETAPQLRSLVLAVAVALPFAVTYWAVRTLLDPARSPARAGARRPPDRLMTLTLPVLLLGVAGFWVRSELAWNDVWASDRGAPDRGAVSAHAGCYELTLGRWYPTGMLGHGFGGIVPTRMQLDTARGRPGARAGEPEVEYRGAYRDDVEAGQLLVRPGWWGGAYWWPHDARRVTVIWSTGYHGVVMQLRRGRGGLSGVAEAFTDVSDSWPTPRARVRARSVPCGTPGA